MAISCYVTIDGTSITTTSAPTDKPFVHDPVTITLDNGSAPGDVQEKTANFSIYDQSGIHGYIAGGASVRITVAGVTVFTGNISDVKIARARRRPENPHRRGIEAQITATAANQVTRAFTIDKQRVMAVQVNFEGRCAYAESAAKRDGAEGVKFIAPTGTKIDNLIMSDQINAESRTVDQIAAYIGESTGHRCYARGTTYRFHLAQFRPTEVVRIPASVMVDNFSFTDRRAENLNSVAVSYRPADGSLPKGEMPRHRWYVQGLIDKYGLNAVVHDVVLFGKQYADGLAHNRINAPRLGWVPDELTILLGHADRLGLPVAGWLRGIMTDGEFLPSLWLDGLPNMGVRIERGGVVEKATLTVNPRPDRAGTERATLTVSVAGGDVMKAIGTVPDLPTNWGEQTDTWAAASLTWETTT